MTGSQSLAKVPDQGTGIMNYCVIGFAIACSAIAISFKR